jgi:hypothetical protein
MSSLGVSTTPTTYADIERWSPVLIRGAVVSLGLLCLAAIALLFDDRLITGMPAFVKPAKFGASGAIYLFTFAFMVRALPPTSALRIATRAISVILVAETVLIFFQAARGEASHFNIDTPLNIAIFSSMGLGIAIVWVMSAVILWLHWRSPSADRAMALALRLGLVLNIVGAGTGWMMTQPRPAQLAAMTRGEHPFVAGTHTIGAPDGGPGIPVVGWSREHGDLRVPHFLGMHALQLLPLLLLGLRRIRGERQDGVEHVVIALSMLCCAAVFAGALLQALAGRPVMSLSLR